MTRASSNRENVRDDTRIPDTNLELLPSAQGEKIHTASAQKLTRVIQYGGLVRR